MTVTDAPDTGAVQGTADYFNRVPNPGTPDCECRGIPDGMHVPPCPHNDTPEARTCEHCGFRSPHKLDVCETCGFIQPKESK